VLAEFLFVVEIPAARIAAKLIRSRSGWSRHAKVLLHLRVQADGHRAVGKFTDLSRAASQNGVMPRKIQSSGESTQGKKTSARRAAGKAKGSSRGRKQDSGVRDGGKWAGSGAKTVESSEGPQIARQATTTGRGSKTRTAMRTMKANHPSHG